MTMTTSLPLAAALLAALAAAPPRWEMLPHPSVYRMANTARAVVEGTLGDAGVVTITRRYYVDRADRIGATITVPALVGMPRAVDAGVLGGRGQDVDPDAVLLFLQDNPKGDEWVPLHLHGAAARGVLWFAGDGAFGYAQWINPGAYGLTRQMVEDGGEAVPATPDELREQVAAGVVARIAWRDTLRIDDLEKRAVAVAEWFSPATSPDGARWRERVWPDLLQACDELGEPVVLPLARIVQADRDAAAAAAAADALGRLGARARPATPALIARLRDPLGVAPIFLVRALRHIADPRARAVLRDFVPHADPFVAAEAALALHAAGGEDAAALLLARIPDEGDELHTVAAIAELVEALHELAPAEAERVVRERFLGLDQLMMQRAWLRRLR